MRRIIANLLGEDDLARAFPSAAPRYLSPSTPRSVQETVSRMAMRLRVFAQEGDRLWLPARAMPDTFVLRELWPILEWGSLALLPPARAVLAWCETPEAAAHRGTPRRPAEICWDAPLHELLWALPTADPRVVAHVHHREFSLHVGRQLGCALPGAQMVASLEELEQLSLPRTWIVKAPLSAAGRCRYLERNGPPISDAKARRTVERLFLHHGALLFEPWMEREQDFGVSALLSQTTLRIVGIHGQSVDGKGQFLGIDLDPVLTDHDRALLVATTESVAQALRQAAYVGPFGIDAWTYRTGAGEIVLNPLGEINARMTFGLLAWAERARLQPATTSLGYRAL